MSLTAQALDAVYGRSAAGVRARLERPTAGGWRAIANTQADDDGHIRDWADGGLEQGAYRIVFDSDSYFANLGLSAAYPEITVTFVLQSDSDVCRIQVLLAPYSCSMFFGPNC